MTEPTSTPVKGALALAALAAVAGLALATLRPPAVAPLDAPPETFSGSRAMATVERLAAAPRPLGSPQHTAAREMLAAALEALGLEVEVQQATAVEAGARRVVSAQVQNVVGRWPGTSGGGAILLLAHYDTRPNTPGAGDDASGVAVILELLRALRHHPPAKRDLLVLLTDAEELGLLGARAFADQHPAIGEVAAVLNVEARGSRGLVSMFETGDGNGPLVRRYARHAVRPMASSFTVEVYRRLPNDTDFSVFRRLGLPGLNFAFIEDLPAYHHALDTPGRLDPRTLQHAGDNLLSLLVDLLADQREELGGRDAVYFSTGLGGWVPTYSPLLAMPLAALLALGALTAVSLAVRDGALTWKEVRWSGIVHLTTLAGVPVVLWASQKVARGMLAAQLTGPHGVPADSDLWSSALVLVGLSLSSAFFASVRTPLAAAAGGLVVWGALAVIAAIAAVGTSFYLAWPLAAMLLGFGAARRWPCWMLAALAAGAAPGLWLLTPLVRTLFVALTVHAAGAVGLFIALALSPGAPVLAALGRRSGWLSWGALAAAVALWGTAVTVPRSAEAPQADSLLYLLDSKNAEARWVTLDDGVDEWTSLALTEAPERQEVPLPGIGRELLAAPAPTVAMPEPELEVLSDDHDGSTRRIRFRLRSPRGAAALVLGIVSGADVTEVAVDGVRKTLDPTAPGRTAEALVLSHWGLSEAGIEVDLTLDAVQPLELFLVDRSPGLPEEAAIGPRPVELTPTSSWWTDATAVLHHSWR